MVEVEINEIEQELQNLETQTEEEVKKEEKEQETADLSDFKPYINYLHQFGFKLANLEPEESIIQEMNETLIKIIEKRIPKIAGFAQNTPEEFIMDRTKFKVTFI